MNAAYMQIANHEIELFPDVPPSLARLRDAGLGLAVLTNGPSDGQRAKIAALGLTRLIDEIFISAELGVAKPQSTVFRRVCGELRSVPSRTLFVGDSTEYDLEGPLAIGAGVAILDRGAKHEERSQPTVASLVDVVQLAAPW